MEVSSLISDHCAQFIYAVIFYFSWVVQRRRRSSNVESVPMPSPIMLLLFVPRHLLLLAHDNDTISSLSFS